ncbi:MAG TPA: hypothetical protein VHQ03_00965 [Candidatus Dormibacteraeota bacterium]|nr:hypothetical protein [Candidatus Dormibacteraeota bacterium]
MDDLATVPELEGFANEVDQARRPRHHEQLRLTAFSDIRGASILRRAEWPVRGILAQYSLPSTSGCRAPMTAIRLIEI